MVAQNEINLVDQPNADTGGEEVSPGIDAGELEIGQQKFSEIQDDVIAFVK